MGVNMQKLMKQAQKMQADMARMQDELKKAQVEGVAGGGMVKAVVTGANEIVSLEINPEVVDPEDVEMLQDLIVAAINDAMRNASEMANREMSKITGGMNIPGMPGL
ncbi:MAG: YbaB/EbfC family nucleoid-associated protein [Clostridia bacterium]|jgi:hypothetical protein|nr:YbaB/EbfC family nucleoid-associated protein [Clostridia bacterium]MDD4572087.1 YbaB/EbfC family nucleoid-associated protein [Clostridia bacterium]